MFHFTTNPPYSNIAKAWRKSTQKFHITKFKTQNYRSKPLICHNFRASPPPQNNFVTKLLQE